MNDHDAIIAELALPSYGFASGASVELINRSENSTFLVIDPLGTRRAVLRVHREGYHSADEIRSELAWMRAVSADTTISTPNVLPTISGDLVLTVPDDGRSRHVVLFDFVRGVEPDEGALVDNDFRTLGSLTARLHNHARQWARPPDFRRFSWDWQATIGPDPRWGRWESLDGLATDAIAVLRAASDQVGRRLAIFGKGPDDFGLIHADLRLTNLLVDGETTHVIDFDDCGDSWNLYDFGSAVSFIEDDPRLGAWAAAWLDGYRQHRQLDAAQAEMLGTFVMLRRLVLMAWMGSHSGTEEVRKRGLIFAEGSVEVAERYLSGYGLFR
ncbi:MAG: Aminoglycoside phosphotransferase [Marmoricola sp.]|nr:Aminoglycoside phosphotransferase [Marmoricola sp.]